MSGRFPSSLGASSPSSTPTSRWSSWTTGPNSGRSSSRRICTNGRTARGIPTRFDSTVTCSASRGSSTGDAVGRANANLPPTVRADVVEPPHPLRAEPGHQNALAGCPVQVGTPPAEGAVGRDDARRVSHEEQVERLIVLLETSSRNVIDLLSQPFEVVADEDNRHASA